MSWEAAAGNGGSEELGSGTVGRGSLRVPFPQTNGKKANYAFPSGPAARAAPIAPGSPAGTASSDTVTLPRGHHGRRTAAAGGEVAQEQPALSHPSRQGVLSVAAGQRNAVRAGNPWAAQVAIREHLLRASAWTRNGIKMYHRIMAVLADQLPWVFLGNRGGKKKKRKSKFLSSAWM